MKAIEIIKLATQAGIYLYVEEGTLKFKAKPGKNHLEILSQVREYKQDILKSLSQERGISDVEPIGKRTLNDEEIPLSFAQQRLWFVDALNEGSAHYNMLFSIAVDGHFNLSEAENAIKNIVARHESLRTVFREKDGECYQVVKTDFDFDLHCVDLQKERTESQKKFITDFISEESRKTFDLQSDLMVRSSFLMTGDQRGVLVFNMHHIASDGWSIGILIREFAKYYEANMSGVKTDLSELTIQYADYACWQREQSEKPLYKKQLGYWKRKLENLPTTHGLSLDFPRPVVKGVKGASYKSYLDTDIATELVELANTNNATIFMLIHAALAMVLSKHGNTNDVVIGTPTANRTRSQLEPLIGFFVNMLVLRVNTEHDTLSDYIKHVTAVNIEAQQNQDIPFEKIVELFGGERRTTYPPLFQILFTMNSNEAVELSLPGVSFELIENNNISTKFDLELDACIEEDGRIKLAWIYDIELFDARSIENLDRHLHVMLDSMTNGFESKVKELKLLGEEEKRYLLEGLNHADIALPANDKLAHELFEQQAKDNPEAIALVFDDAEMCYAELNERANQLARHLQATCDTKGERLVGICLDRSFEMVISILAVLKSGGAYVPMDPGYPAARLNYMIEDANLKQIITNKDIKTTLGIGAEQSICIDDYCINLVLQNYSKENIDRVGAGLTASNLAYVIYTSGSTGKPKGVMVEHQSLVDRFQAFNGFITLELGDKVPNIASFAFDISLVEILYPLSLGASTKIIKSYDIKNIQSLSYLLADCTFIHMVPSLLQAWLENLKSTKETLSYENIKLVATGGDRVPAELIATFSKTLPNCHLTQFYGPTEATLFCLYEKDALENPSTIGATILGTTAYVMDVNGNDMVPIGVPGELYLGGNGLARGYLDRAELTSERFIQDPFSKDSLSRCYKTGDLVRRRTNGHLEFLGRIDDQVKIRGFRIELGEIEYQLLLAENVSASVVTVHEDAVGDKRLAAYVVPSNELNADKKAGYIEGLRSWLDKVLADYMIPSAYVVLDKLPLTPNGKVDKRALPVPDISQQQANYVAPESNYEKILCAICSDLLGVERVSIYDNFFQLGGHSLLATKLVAGVRDKLDLELSIKNVFEAGNLKELAGRIEDCQKTLIDAISPRSATVKRIPLSFAQQRLWFIDVLNEGSANYNMLFSIAVDGDFNISAAEKAINDVISRHESLRTIFSEQDGKSYQIVKANFEFDLATVDLQKHSSAEQEKLINDFISEDSNKPFNLQSDLMVRSSFLITGFQRGVLIFNIHHIASDGWSTGILVREFAKYYEAHVTGKEADFSELAIQYADYACWQREQDEKQVFKDQLGYWEEKLSNLPTIHGLPIDYPRPPEKGVKGELHTSSVGANTVTGLVELANQNNATMFMLLHAALAIVLSRHGNTNDIVIGTPSANRTRSELAPLIGFFVNMLVLRVNTEHETLQDYIKHVVKVNIEALENQDIPFEQIVERCVGSRSVAYTPLFQILFTMNADESVELSLPGVSFELVENNNITTKFDLELDASVDKNGQLQLTWVYDVELFDANSIDVLDKHLHSVLDSMMSGPESKVGELKILSDAETRYLLEELNPVDASLVSDEKLVHELFEQHARENPHGTALVFDEAEMSYAELNERANQLARHLRDICDIQGDSLVGICLDRSFEKVIAILATLKSGGAYVPMDPSYPNFRLNYMIEDAELKKIITSTEIKPKLGLNDEQCICIDEDKFDHVLQTYSKENIDRDGIGLTASNLAYVIYTSGSTGKPKGVMVEHKNLARVKTMCDQHFELDSTDVWCIFHSFSFDFSVWELFGGLITGAKIIIVSYWQSRSPEDFRKLLQKYGVTVLNQSPSSFYSLTHHEAECRDMLPIKYVIFGGESLTVQSINPWLDKYGDELPTFVNMYGITEITIHASYKEISIDEIRSADPKNNIGRMVCDLNAYILDSNQNLCPVGTTGELYIEGQGVVRGYLNREALTDERFITNTALSKTGKRLYKTGDLARWLKNGELEYMGRADDQIQIRGFRIETGEIEYCLNIQPSVSQSVVVAKDDANGNKYLVAYVVPTA